MAWHRMGRSDRIYYSTQLYPARVKIDIVGVQGRKLVIVQDGIILQRRPTARRCLDGAGRADLVQGGFLGDAAARHLGGVRGERSLVLLQHPLRPDGDVSTEQ
eukprot:SAG22_NODE_2170_length_2894_cov_4.900894_2_plen_103_part_00